MPSTAHPQLTRPICFSFFVSAQCFSYDRFQKPATASIAGHSPVLHKSHCSFLQTHVSNVCPQPIRRGGFRRSTTCKFAAFETSASFQPALRLLQRINRLFPATTGSIWGVWALIAITATFGLFAERTRWGAALSAPLVTMFTTLVLCNFGVLPTTSAVYQFVNQVLVLMAVPLLLFEADLRKVFRETGKLLVAFLVGTVGTVVGTVVAWRLVPLGRSLGKDGWKIAAALAARHIGGAVNYVATTEALDASASIVASGVAADNLIVAIYFLALFALARNIVYNAPKHTGPPKHTNHGVLGAENITLEESSSTITIHEIACALSIAAILCALAKGIDAMLPVPLGAIPIVTLLVVTAATVAPWLLRPYRKAGNVIGILFMQFFFAITGAGGSVLTVLATAPLIFLFSTVQLTTHLAFIFGLGKLTLRIRLEELLLASNANVGGPTTAAGMATAKRWDELLIPSLLVGVFGYSIATFVSLPLGHLILKKWP